jgi:PilZ domain
MSPDPEFGPPTDRRRHLRYPPPRDLELSIPIVTQGEVIDLSLTGALISTPVRLAAGDRARLSLLVGREPFGAWVRVVRSEEGTRNGRTVRYHLGLVFTSMDEQNRQVLQRFVRRDSPPNG